MFGFRRVPKAALLLIGFLACSDFERLGPNFLAEMVLILNAQFGTKRKPNKIGSKPNETGSKPVWNQFCIQKYDVFSGQMGQNQFGTDLVS